MSRKGNQGLTHTFTQRFIPFWSAELFLMDVDRWTSVLFACKSSVPMPFSVNLSVTEILEAQMTIWFFR